MVLRTFSHATIEGMAITLYSRHQCAQRSGTSVPGARRFFTLKEQFGDLRNIKLAYVGDGNNVVYSLLLTGARSGRAFGSLPRNYEPKAEIVARPARSPPNRRTIEMIVTILTRVTGANAIYTDAWASMGGNKKQTSAKDLRALSGERTLMAGG